MQSGVRAIQSVDKQRQLPVEINRLRRWFARGSPEDLQLVSFQCRIFAGALFAD
jgi:hypothetical protein